MSSSEVVRFIYRTLIRQINKSVPKDGTIQLRKPVSQMWGSYGFAKSGKDYEVDVIDTVLPTLYFTPRSTRLTREDLLQLVRSNFKIQRQAPKKTASELLDNAFYCLRSLLDQRRLDKCSSEAYTNGLLVEATSQFSNEGRNWKGQREYVFSYRIRIINLRDESVQLLGREWKIFDESQRLTAHVPLSFDNSIVGQQPVLRPGTCFEYYSGTPLPTPIGIQRGRIAAIVLYDKEAEGEGENSAAAAAATATATGATTSSPKAKEEGEAKENSNPEAGRHAREVEIIADVAPFYHLHPSVESSAADGRRRSAAGVATASEAEGDKL